MLKIPPGHAETFTPRSDKPAAFPPKVPARHLETLPDRSYQGIRSLSLRSINSLTDYRPKFHWDTQTPPKKAEPP